MISILDPSLRYFLNEAHEVAMNIAFPEAYRGLTSVTTRLSVLQEVIHLKCFTSLFNVASK